MSDYKLHKEPNQREKNSKELHQLLEHKTYRDIPKTQNSVRHDRAYRNKQMILALLAE